MKKNIYTPLILAFAILLTVWILLVFSFIPSLQKTYQGYIYFRNSPIINAKIIEENTNNSNYTFSDEKGYFRLKKKILIGLII